MYPLGSDWWDGAGSRTDGCKLQNREDLEYLAPGSQWPPGMTHSLLHNHTRHPLGATLHLSQSFISQQFFPPAPPPINTHPSGAALLEAPLAGELAATQPSCRTGPTSSLGPPALQSRLLIIHSLRTTDGGMHQTMVYFFVTHLHFTQNLYRHTGKVSEVNLTPNSFLHCRQISLKKNFI